MALPGSESWCCHQTDEQCGDLEHRKVYSDAEQGQYNKKPGEVYYVVTRSEGSRPCKVLPLTTKNIGLPGASRRLAPPSTQNRIDGDAEDTASERKGFDGCLLSYFCENTNKPLGFCWARSFGWRGKVARKDISNLSVLCTQSPEDQRVHIGVLDRWLLIDPWDKELRFYHGKPENLDSDYVELSELPLDVQKGDDLNPRNSTAGTQSPQDPEATFKAQMAVAKCGGSKPAEKYFHLRYWGLGPSVDPPSSELMSSSLGGDETVENVDTQYSPQSSKTSQAMTPAPSGIHNLEDPFERVLTKLPYEDLFDEWTEGEWTTAGIATQSPNSIFLHDSEMTDVAAAEGEVPSSLEPSLTSLLDFEVSAAVELPLDWPNEYDPTLLT